MPKQNLVTVRHADGRVEVVKPSRITDRKKFNYAGYRRSKRWKELRRKVLDRDGHRCTLCRRDERLEVHHITYERLGREELADLVTLCQRCHATEHQWRRRAWVRGPDA